MYPSGGYYNIAKQGEDVDFEFIFKEIAIQPLFFDKKVLFNDFLGSIFGNIDSLQDTIGKVTYEKITNFVDNNAVLDFSFYCDMDQNSYPHPNGLSMSGLLKGLSYTNFNTNGPL